jgi:hypothetical protein
MIVMADSTPTRSETVAANIEAAEETGDTKVIQTQCLKDISISLAMLVDAGSSDS